MYYTTLPFTLAASETAYLIDVDAMYQQFSTLVDQRKRRGVRYPLAVILTIAVLAKLAGYSRLQDIAEWACLRRHDLAALFALSRTTMPHVATWSRILGHAVVVDALELVAAALVAPPTTGEIPGRATIEVNIDGKTLRGTIPSGKTSGVHLLAAYCPTQGIVLFQIQVDVKANEISAAPILLRRLDLTGMLITGDAMFTQRALSIQIVEGGGEYLWQVKDNQPTLLADIELLFQPEYVKAGWSALPVDFRTARTVTSGHGRIEERVITVSSLLKDYSDWPYLEQVFKLETYTQEVVTGKETRTVRYGITSAPVAVRDAASLLASVRRHWSIETGLHSRRDGSLEEDASRVRRGHAPHVIATLNNLVLGLFAQMGITQVAAAQRGVAYGIDRQLHAINVGREHQIPLGGTLQ